MKILDDLKNIDLSGVDLKNPRTQKALLVVLVSLVASALYLYFIFFPQIGRVLSLAGRTINMASNLKSAKTLVAEKDRLSKNFDEYSRKVESYENKLPAEQEIPSLLENLSAMAKESNIKIISIMPAASYFKTDKAQKKSQIYQEIPILITAKSGYHELGSFLHNLENASRFMKVVDISIKADKTALRKHDVDLMVCTYILLLEK